MDYRPANGYRWARDAHGGAYRRKRGRVTSLPLLSLKIELPANFPNRIN